MPIFFYQDKDNYYRHIEGDHEGPGSLTVLGRDGRSFYPIPPSAVMYDKVKRLQKEQDRWPHTYPGDWKRAAQRAAEYLLNHEKETV